MKTSITLSPEQQKAKELYDSTYWVVLFILCCLLYPCVKLLEGSLIKSGWFGGHVGSIYILFISSLLAPRLSEWRVRRAGLFQQSKTFEVLRKTSTDFSGERIEWWAPSTDLGKTAFIVFVFFRIGVGWFLWSPPPFSWNHHPIGAAAFIVSIALGIFDLLTVNFPRVSIDEAGVVGFEKIWWRQRARWQEIACCEIKRVKNFSPQKGAYRFTFKDENGKVLLDLRPTSLQGLNVGELEEIEAEIKRRLAGKPQN